MRELSLNGYIDDESWFGDEITPESLHDLLYGTEDIEELFTCQCQQVHGVINDDNINILP